MSGIDLGLILTNFSDADLAGADFSKSSLLLTDFSNADLTNVNFTKTELRFTDLSGVDMSRVELYDISALALLGCPASLPEGWLCIADPLMGACPVSEGGEDREEYVQLMGIFWIL